MLQEEGRGGGVAHEELMCVRDRGPESVLGGESVKNKIAL